MAPETHKMQLHFVYKREDELNDVMQLAGAEMIDRKRKT